MEYEQQMVELGVALSHLAVRGTVSAVNKKLRAAKNIKDIETLRNTYDEILNEVLSEREEAVNIAQAYKAELDRIEISDEDIVNFITDEINKAQERKKEANIKRREKQKQAKAAAVQKTIEAAKDLIETQVAAVLKEENTPRYMQI